MSQPLTSDTSPVTVTTLTGGQKQPETPKEAARQFEEVFVRQFVKTMTDGMFESRLNGSQSGATNRQAAMQSDVLTDVLTSKLVEQDSFGLSDLVTQQWIQSGRLNKSSD